jgi:2-polyprenyl-3-methyl-5-hydroxy-6-metoxy-1,4-benzoquinol methylase
MTDRATLLRQAARIDWFHAIDFGDCQSPGRFAPNTPQNRTLYGIMDMLSDIDLTGLDCLDIGTADGLVAFNMASRGAARVVATDVPPEGRPGFKTARELLDIDVDLRPGITFENVADELGENSFDVVVCAGVFYHMLNPFDSLLKSRRLLKRNGLLLFQTRHHPDETGATMDFNPVSERLDALNVFWVPSRSAIDGMLALAGFQVLAVRTGTHHEFLSAIAVNVDPEELQDPPGTIGRQHDAGIRFAEFQRQLPDEASPVVYSGRPGDMIIDDATYVPNFPPHPSEPKPVVGEPFHKPPPG